MRQSIFVTSVLCLGQLPGPLIQLGRHVRRFFLGTTQRDQHRRELTPVHQLLRSAMGASWRNGYAAGVRLEPHTMVQAYFTESAGTILMLSTPTRLFGRSGGCVGVVAIFSSTSSPLINFPKAVY